MTRRLDFLKQILSEDVSCQQILFSSADFVSRFLLSADFVFVSRFRQKIFFVSRFVFRQQMSFHLSTKRPSRRHIHFHASLFREGNTFSSGRRAFSLQSRLHSFCRTFLSHKKTPEISLLRKNSGILPKRQVIQINVNESYRFMYRFIYRLHDFNVHFSISKSEKSAHLSFRVK